MKILFDCSENWMRLKNIFGRDNKPSRSNGNKSSRDIKVIEPSIHSPYFSFSKGKRFNSKPQQARESFRSVLRPSNKPGDFLVLTPVSHTHLRENYEEHPEPLGKAALRRGIARFNSGQFESARYYYEVAATYNEVCAVHNLGTMYLHGQGIPKDPNIAREYFIQCATKDVALSMSQLGYIYLYGKGVSPNYQKARAWLLRANSIGNEPYAQYCLSIIYICGYGVDKDISRGMAWLCKSAENNFWPAVFELAILYERGEYGLDPCPQLAMRLYMKSAYDGGDESAQNNLGALYCKVGRNYREAIKLFRMAEKKGLPEAMINLGEAYINGIGVARDIMQGAQYYYHAAKTGNSTAEYALANVFLYGIDKQMKPNLKIAMYWLERAANNGHKGARKSLRILRARTQRA